MSFNSVSDYFKFTRVQRTGIFVLFGIVLVLQLVYFFIDSNPIEVENREKQEWLALQSEVELLKGERKESKIKMYPFNPNFISDYKGYQLGMSVVQIDRLLAFRKEGKFVNSAKEFQEVTKISDSLLNVMAPFFKFPDWVNRKKEGKVYNTTFTAFVKKEKIVPIDINQATKDDLIKINGIGEVIAHRILTQKEKIGGFVSMSQLNEIWGLSPEVLVHLNTYFRITKQPDLHKINVNNASLKELLQFFYFKSDLARQIVKYRSMNGDFKNIEDLMKVNGFPVEKSNIIVLYLDF